MNTTNDIKTNIEKKISEQAARLVKNGWVNHGVVEEGFDCFGVKLTKGNGWNMQTTYLNFHTIAGYVSV